MSVATRPVVDTGIALEGVSKRFGRGVQALAQVDFAFRPGEFVSIVGPSGCGKSTLLRIAARLIEPSTGRCNRPAGLRSAFVFQEAALLPWRTVEANAQLLMELEGESPADYRPRAAAALALVGLKGFEKAYPHELSGGMRMRLSLARALALRPGLLLLDEPLAAVDELTRDVLQEELSALWQEAGFTAALVTHNVHEAVFLSNRVIVMSPRPGRILDVIELFALHNTSRWTAFWKLRLPGALPSIMAGLRISAGLSVIGAIVGEFIIGSGNAQGGLGVQIVFAQGRMYTALLFAEVIGATLLGFVFFSIVSFVGNRLLRHWHESAVGH